MQESILLVLKDFYYTISNNGETGNFDVFVTSKAYQADGYKNKFKLLYNSAGTNFELTFTTFVNNIGNIEKSLKFEIWNDDGYIEYHCLVLDTPEEIFQQSLLDNPPGYDGILSEENYLQLKMSIKYYLTEYAFDVLQ